MLLALWIVALLSLLAYGLMSAVRMGLREEKWSKAEFEADELLSGLGGMAFARLRADQNTDMDSLQEDWGRLYQSDSLTLLSKFEGVDATRGDFVLTVIPVDELGKVNVNVAGTGLLEMLLRSAGAGHMAPEIALAICDWRDPDEEGIAEADYYSGLEPAYAPADADLARIEELLFVKDVTPTLFFGEDANHNGVLDPNEDDGDAFLPPDNADGRLQLGLIDMLTVCGETDDAAINANTASEPILFAVFASTVANEEEAAKMTMALLAHRRGADGMDGTDDDNPFQAQEGIVAFLALTLGEDEPLVALAAARSLEVSSAAFRFHLRVQMPERHLLREAELLVSREDGELRVLEWHEG